MNGSLENHPHKIEVLLIYLVNNILLYSDYSSENVCLHKYAISIPYLSPKNTSKHSM